MFAFACRLAFNIPIYPKIAILRLIEELSSRLWGGHQELVPEACHWSGGCPQVQEDESGWDVLEALPFSTWSEAHLIPPMRYLRGNRHLQLPPVWLSAMPRPLEILHSLEQRRLAQNGHDLPE